MTRRVLGRQFTPALQAAIQEGRKSFSSSRTAEGAKNTCGSLSSVFEGTMLRHGARGGTVDMIRGGRQHVVNVAEGHVIDWTARQFNSRAPVPDIQPVKSLKQYDDVRPVSSTSRRRKRLGESPAR